jgi:hypothetical protein
MVVGFTTTYAISAYPHRCCEFQSRSGRGLQHYVIKFVSDLRQVGGEYAVKIVVIHVSSNLMLTLIESRKYIKPLYYRTNNATKLKVALNTIKQTNHIIKVSYRKSPSRYDFYPICEIIVIELFQ